MEANIARIGRFCAEQYVYDPRSDPRTAEICHIIDRLRQKLGQIHRQVGFNQYGTLIFIANQHFYLKKYACSCVSQRLWKFTLMIV